MQSLWDNLSLEDLVFVNAKVVTLNNLITSRKLWNAQTL